MTRTNTLLQGRTALITGAGSGIGRAAALALAEAGANVVVTARRQATGDETLALIESEGGKGIAVPVDVTAFEDVQRAVQAAVSAFGGLDIVIHNANNAASAMPIALEETSEEKWDEQARVAWHGAFHCAKAAFAELRRSGQGRYILLGSNFGLHGAAMNPTYSALKGGDRGFVKALAREWGPHGIAVNLLCPAALTEPAEIFFSQNPAIRDMYLANFPMRNIGRPREDIGAAIVALSSDGFRYITGQVINVDGGLYTAL